MSCTLLTVKRTGLNKDSQIQFTSQHSNLKKTKKKKTMYEYIVVPFIKILQKMNPKSKMLKIQNTRQARWLATRQE